VVAEPLGPTVPHTGGATLDGCEVDAAGCGRPSDGGPDDTSRPNRLPADGGSLGARDDTRGRDLAQDRDPADLEEVAGVPVGPQVADGRAGTGQTRHAR
jgi:hypothetical protein